MKLTLVVAALSLTVGCIQERQYMDPNARLVDLGMNDDGYGGGQEANVKTARLQGDIGPVRGLDDEANAYGTDDEFGSSFTVDAQTNRGYGLVMIYLQNSIFSMPAGRTHFTGNNETMEGDYVQLCSDTPDGTHFDGIAHDVDLVVTPREDGARDVEVEATITDGWDGASYDGAEPTIARSQFRVHPTE